MARQPASDRDEKRSGIRKAAARLFAVQGYDAASMAEIAAACSVSKALVYHYYASKEDILFDIIHAHLAELAAAAEGVDEREPRARLGALISALLDAYRDADDEHQVQLSAMKRLSPERRAELLALERRLVSVLSEAVVAVVPALGAEKSRLKPVVMNIFGMMNWKFMWFREGGTLTHADFASLVLTMAEAGAKAAAVQRGPRISQM